MERNFLFCLLLIISICSDHVESLSIDTEGPNERILGGTTAARIAWMVSVRSYNVQTNYHVCGGFIINPRWVGTAGQCVTNKTIYDTAVSVGANGISAGELFTLQQIQFHQNFSDTTLQNDIALLRTDRPFVYSASVNSIYLATSNTFIGPTVIIHGWGSIVAGGNFNANLLEGAFNVMAYAACLDRFPFVTRPYITEQHICTHLSTRATCPGDAGGAVVFNGTVVAIASWVEPCLAGQTNVNVRISSYVTWIRGFTQADD